VSDTHDNVVGNNLDTLGWKVFPEPGFCEVVVDFVNRHRLIVAQDHRESDFSIRTRFLGAQGDGEKEQYKREYPFHRRQA
jgi:hypothetical protein